VFGAGPPRCSKLGDRGYDEVLGSKRSTAGRAMTVQGDEGR
jgi:hypothetical protein